MNSDIKQRIEQINRGEVPGGYKKTAVGIVPQEWEYKKLKNIGKFSKGKGLPGSEMKATGVPCIGYGDIYTKYNYKFDKAQNFVSQEVANNSLKCPKNSLFFTCSGETAIEIGKCVCYTGDEDIYVGGDIAVLSANAEVVPLFVGYQQNIPSLIKQKARFGQGHSVVHIYADSLEKLGVAYPKNTNEQQRIADILSKWDEAIELQEKLIEKLELQKKALMQRLLTPKEDWEKVKLGSVIRKQKAILVNTNENGKNPIIDMDYLINKSFCNYTNDEGTRADLNDVLLLWDGSGAGTPIHKVEGVVGSTFAKLTPNHEILPGFLYYYLLKIQERNKLLREGSGVPHIPKDFLRMQIISFPTKTIQKNIVDILENFDSQINYYNKKLEILKQQQKAMQQLLLTGIVRV